MDAWLDAKPRRVLFLTGVKGCGKTTASNKFLTERGYAPLTIDITDYDGPVALNEFIYKQLEYVGIMDAYKGRKTKAVIFENLESIYSNVSFVREIVKILRRINESPQGIPVICNVVELAEQFRKYVGSARGAFATVVEMKWNADEVRAYLRTALKGPKAIEHIIGRFTGDYRELQRLVEDLRKHTRLTVARVDEAYDNYLKEDIHDKCDVIADNILELYLGNGSSYEALHSQIKHSGEHDKIRALLYKGCTEKAYGASSDGKTFWKTLYNLRRLIESDAAFTFT